MIVIVIILCKISEIKNWITKEGQIDFYRFLPFLCLSEIISLTIYLNWLDGSERHL